MAKIVISSLCGTDNISDLFWDDNLTINSNVPDFTRCFENTAFIWSLFIFFSLAASVKIPFLFLSPTVNQRKHGGFLFYSKTIFGTTLIILYLVKAIFNLNYSHNRSVDILMEPFLQLIMSLLAMIIICMGFYKGKRISCILFLFYFFSSVINIIILRSCILQHNLKRTIIINSIQTALSSILFFLHCFADKKSIHWLRRQTNTIINERTPLLVNETENERLFDNLELHQKINKPPCPESFSSIPLLWTHSWIFPLIFKGYRKTLTFDDLNDLPNNEKCSAIVPEFMKIYEKKYREIDSIKPIKEQIEGKKAPFTLFMMLISSCKRPFFTAGVLRLLFVIPDIASSLLLRPLLRFIQSENYEQPIWHGYFIAVMMLLNTFVHSILVQMYYKQTYTVAQRMRTIIGSLVFRKSLRLSAASRAKTTSGEIVNLMSVDAQKIHDMMLNIHELWACPVTVIGVLYFMWSVIGPSCMAGFGFLAIMAPFTGGVLAAKYAKMETIQMGLKDKRLKVMNEILSNIKVLKFYAWEKWFAKKINTIRLDELKTLRKQALYNMGLGMVWYTAPFIVTLIIFIVYVLSSSSHHLDPEKTFVTLSFIGLLNNCLSFLPMLIGFSAQAYVSLERISHLISQEELNDEHIIREKAINDNGIIIEDATFTWGDPDSDACLKNINLSIKTSNLVAVVGGVGSGKSSLVSAILGDNRVLSGKIKVGGSIAYLSQQAWIQNATLKKNITFVSKMSVDYYNEVVDACELRSDLDQLSASDETEIGEKGINLSGGQKQRVALGRAVYSNSDIYLLDDPLSAVDAHVGQNIFQNVIGPEGILKHKTRILVTHSIHVLSMCDNVIMLENGKIIGEGKFLDLLKNCKQFKELVTKSQMEEEVESTNDVNSQENITERRFSECTAVSRSQSEIETKKKNVSFSFSKENLSVDGRLIEEEEEEIGSVKFSVIKEYVKSGGISLLFMMILATIIYIGLTVGTNIWLSFWSELPKNTTSSETYKRLGGYVGLGLSQIIFTCVGQACILFGGVIASRILHERLLWRILRAPMSFFDKTPLGRILNRFSSDMERIDCSIPDLTCWWLGCFSTVFSTLIGISYTTPYFLIGALPLSIIYIFVQRIYISSVRQLKRIHSVRKSPIYSSFDETLSGTSIIRAFDVSSNFIEKNENLLNNSMTAWYPILVAQRWLGVTLDIIGAFVVFFAAFFAVYLKDSASPITAGLVGMSINFALENCYSMSMLVRASTDLETNVVSVERVENYSNVEQESEWEQTDDPPSSWPTEGKLVLEKVNVRYNTHLPMVLKNISLTINPSEKLGIVGRTGAGKSSLTSVLFRILELYSGRILIDDVDISNIGLHTLRKIMTIIPQDPILFGGSLRNNLDPTGTHNDESIWRVLELSHLKEFVEEKMNNDLNSECGEGGSSLSVGQRQLVCLARALLRNTKILILDEATASVDAKTDSLIQSTIRTAFSKCTVLTIAHRLVTIMDYDRVVVLGDGKILEMGKPKDLNNKEDGYFYQMVKEAGFKTN